MKKEMRDSLEEACSLIWFSSPKPFQVSLDFFNSVNLPPKFAYLFFNSADLIWTPASVEILRWDHKCWKKNRFFPVSPRLTGQCHEIFHFWFFSSISFPPAPEYPIRTVSKFFENSRRYSQLIFPRIFEKIRNGPSGILRGLGETDSCKKPEAKNLVTLSL